MKEKLKEKYVPSIIETVS